MPRAPVTREIATTQRRRVTSNLLIQNMGDKNLLLVKSIEKFPCLYNYNLIDYSKKELTDRAWAEVASEVKFTVAECKEKWKNLRYGFIRSLRPNPDGSVKKKYYLHEDMEFVLPFIKLIPKHINVLPPIDGDTDEENIENLIENGHYGQSPHLIELDLFHNNEPPRKRVRTHESYSKYVQRKNVEKFDDSRKMFLLSLLPEVNELTESQMRAFRRKVLALLDEIVDTPNQCDTNINQLNKEIQGNDFLQTDILIKNEIP